MKRNFTLIEMLIVVAIIGILAALLMPGLRKSYDNAAMLSCANNMRQNGFVFFSYAGDYNSHFPGYGFDKDDPEWMPGQGRKMHYRHLNLTILLQAYQSGQLEQENISKQGTWMCPACENREHRRPAGWVADVCYGVNGYQYGLRDTPAGHRGVNPNRKADGESVYHNDFRNPFRFAKMAPNIGKWRGCKDRTKIMLLGETTISWGYWVLNGLADIAGNPQEYINGAAGYRWRLALNHGSQKKGSNYLFLDGHVKSYPNLLVENPFGWD